MAELHVIQPHAAKVVTAVVEALEHELEKARRGELIGVAIAGVYGDGSGHHAWSAMAQAHPLLGAVTILQHALADEIYAGSSGDRGPTDQG